MGTSFHCETKRDEGGLALAVDGLHISPVLGVYVGLITRLRELLWIAIGMILIKIGNRKS